ncbi:MAG TPA: choice-of-anchor tandem repeat GloVer-containing protein [Bryobacteraceae bacterium]|nr:choice-of-anchor tandem repeat GloVer-containing protein [Bryobacteraceae bacterium]
MISRIGWCPALMLASLFSAPAIVTQAQTFLVLHTFAGGTDGIAPVGTPVLYGGSLYGATYSGGSSGSGIIFQVDLNTFKETVLHSFSSSDGINPPGGLIQDSAGNFYGATQGGGTYADGTVFQMSATGSLSVLYDFNNSGNTNAQTPNGTLARDSAGNLYGTTAFGGNGSGLGCGTVFKLPVIGQVGLLHKFSCQPDGSLPKSGLLLAQSTGYLYGAMSAGGAYNFGTVFEVNSNTGIFTLLYTFSGGADGGNPWVEGGLIADESGNLYGTTLTGGNGSGGAGDGVIFKINIATGQETVLYTFAGPDGANPRTGVVRDSNGNLYGTTYNGGAFNAGTVFKLDTAGNLTTLHSFTGGADGANPEAAVVRDSSGNLYGTASIGGVSECFNGCGTVFEITTAGPPVPSINSGGVVNAASYTAPVVPGSIAAAFGNFLLGSPSGAQSIPLPTDLSGLSLAFGNGVDAPLFFASGLQVNFQVPWELAGQTQASVTASIGGQTSSPQTVNLAPFAPAIFSINSAGTGQGAVLDTSYRLVDASNPAIPGSTYIQIYCTGLGPVSNQPTSGHPAPDVPPFAETTTTPTVNIGNVPAQVLFSGLAPGFVGLYQVNAQVPAGAPGGASIPVTVSMGGITSNTVTIVVQGPTTTFAVTNEMTAGSVPEDSSGNLTCAVPIAQNVFQPTDPAVWVWFSFNGGQTGDVLTVSWIKPSGAVYLQSQSATITFNGSSCWAAGIYIGGHEPATDPGTWHVSVFRNGGSLFTLPFTVTAPQASAAGTWQGTWSSVTGVSGSFGATIAQNGTALAGTLVLLNSSCFVVGNINGTITNNALSFGVFFSLVGPTSQVAFTATLNSVGSGTGQYSVQSGPCAGDSGTFSMTMLPSQPSVAGNWQGTWSSVLGLTGSVSAAISQTGTTLTAPITLNGSPCFTNGTASGSIIAQEMLLEATFNGTLQVVLDGMLDSSGATITGAYVVVAGACSGDSGSLFLTKIQ